MVPNHDDPYSGGKFSLLLLVQRMTPYNTDGFKRIGDANSVDNLTSG
jgi:hypothetical protein